MPRTMARAATLAVRLLGTPVPLAQLVNSPRSSLPELHRGFYESYLALRPGVTAALLALNASTAPFVAVTGHSLGAAIAEVAAFELVAEGLPVATAYTFGTPREGNPAWASAYEAAVDTQAGVASFRVIHDRDPVPHLPPKVSSSEIHLPRLMYTQPFP